MASKFEVKQDARGEWRWNLRASNGRVIADSGEGYSSEQKCREGIESVKREAPNASVEGTA